MTVDVAFAPNDIAAATVAHRPVVVVDVLRATTTICAALANGARAVIPAAEPSEATRLAQAIDTRDVILAGERKLDPIPGFHLGNSPREMTADAVAGRTIIMSTTNGTSALLATLGAREVIVAAGVNLAAVAERAREMLEEHGDLLVLCAGRETGFGIDDAYLAGRVVLGAMSGRRTRKGLNDSAIAAVDLVRRYGDRLDRVLGMSRAGRDLRAHGLGDDVAYAGMLDIHPVVPVFRDRRVTLAAPRS